MPHTGMLPVVASTTVSMPLSLSFAPGFPAPYLSLAVYLVKDDGWHKMAAVDVNELHYKYAAEAEAAGAAAAQA